MSPKAAASRHIRNEVNLAFSEGKDLLVVFLEETRMTEGMQLQMGAVQHLKKYELTEKEFGKALRSVLNSEIRS